jgi:hypothetical protein
MSHDSSAISLLSQIACNYGGTFLLLCNRGAPLDASFVMLFGYFCQQPQAGHTRWRALFPLLIWYDEGPEKTMLMAAILHDTGRLLFFLDPESPHWMGIVLDEMFLVRHFSPYLRRSDGSPI